MSTDMHSKTIQTESSIETTVYGKTILLGEHAVLRGCPALVCPVFARSLKLKFQQTDAPLSLSLSGSHGQELKLLFWGVIERAFEMLGVPRDQVKGHFEIESTIPVGAGMGASAALCVGVGRWFEWKKLVASDDLLEFCRQLENLFHGESSGLDIAVALYGRGLRYVRGGERTPVQFAWKPNWYVSYSGKRGVTSECIQKVKQLSDANPTFAVSIDEQMKQAVLKAEAALMAPESETALDQLALAINHARGCFNEWGLAGGEMGHHLDELVKAGAMAVKPTGSGDGGFVLSLWRSTPPTALSNQLIPL